MKKNLSSYITTIIFGYLLCNLFYEFINSKLSDFIPKEIYLILVNFISSITLVSLIFSFFCHFLWKIKPINFLSSFLFSINPKIYGTWKGTMSYEYNNEKLEKTVFLSIHQQNAFEIECNYFTDNRESYSKTAILLETNHNLSLVYQYFAKEDLKRRNENPSHEGTCILDLIENQKTLRGQYFTDNNTKGTILLKKISNKESDSFESAKRICEQFLSLKSCLEKSFVI